MPIHILRTTMLEGLWERDEPEKAEEVAQKGRNRRKGASRWAAIKKTRGIRSDCRQNESDDTNRNYRDR